MWIKLSSFASMVVRWNDSSASKTLGGNSRDVKTLSTNVAVTNKAHLATADFNSREEGSVNFTQKK
jgi:hypothetical protein